MRLRIVELPRSTVNDPIPFVLLFDQVNASDVMVIEQEAARMATASGARGVLALNTTVTLAADED